MPGSGRMSNPGKTLYITACVAAPPHLIVALVVRHSHEAQISPTLVAMHLGRSFTESLLLWRRVARILDAVGSEATGRTDHCLRRMSGLKPRGVADGLKARTRTQAESDSVTEMKRRVYALLSAGRDSTEANRGALAFLQIFLTVIADAVPSSECYACQQKKHLLSLGPYPVGFLPTI